MSEFPYYGTSMGKQRQFPGFVLPYRFTVNWNPCNHQCLGMCKLLFHENILWKDISFPSCEFLRFFPIHGFGEIFPVRESATESNLA